MCVCGRVALGEVEGRREALQRRRRRPDSFPAHSAPRLSRLPQRSASSVSRRRRGRLRRYSDRRRNPRQQPRMPVRCRGPVSGPGEGAGNGAGQPRMPVPFGVEARGRPMPSVPAPDEAAPSRARLPVPCQPRLLPGPPRRGPGRAPSAAIPGSPILGAGRVGRVANRHWDPAAADLRGRYCSPRRPETVIGPLRWSGKGAVGR